MEASLSVLTENQKKETQVTRGRKPKVKAAPKKNERLELLKRSILGLPDELKSRGFGAFLKEATEIIPIDKVILDPLTDGKIGHAVEPLGKYIKRVSIVDNFSQRPPFDHLTDTIYRRLIVDFLDGAVMPESKIAALGESSSKRAASLDEENIQYSIIDGLQRLYCYCIAILLVLRKEKLIDDGCILPEHWNEFADLEIMKMDQRNAIEALLQRIIRFEIFYDIDLEGLLHYMVTFNTGQRRMSFSVQLEIMRQPLIQELEKNAKIPLTHEIDSMPGTKRDRDKFIASDLILATQAFITHNPHVTATKEAERILDERPDFLADIGDVSDVVGTLKRITVEIHPLILNVYAADPGKRFILSGGGVFFISLCAACGYIRHRNNMKMLDGALDKLVSQIERPTDDPLKLNEYQEALGTITASRGKATRRLVYDTFLRFFTGATSELEWMDTARGI